MQIWRLNNNKWRYYQRQWQNFVSYTNLHKIRSRQPRDLKLWGVIVYMEFHKIWDFQIPTTWNDFMMTSSLCFSESAHKTCQRQTTELKLCKLIVQSKFHKICKFENHVTRNDVIMMSLSKTMKNNGELRTSAKPYKLYTNRKVDESCPKMYFLLNLSHYVKSCGHFCQILASFLRYPLTKYGHITWPKKQISKIFYFLLILHLILGKVTKFLVEKLSTSEVIGLIALCWKLWIQIFSTEKTP